MTTKRILAAAFVICALATHARAARADALPIAPLEWLVGGTWVAQGADMPPDTSRIETQYRMAVSGNFIEFTTAFLDRSGKPSGNYAGNLYYDPTTKRLTMWYMDRQNAITQGPVTVSPQGMSMTFTEDGTSMGASGPVDFQVTVAKTSENAYRWTLAARKGGSSASYKPLFSLDYSRVDGTPGS